jgi:heme A synthase
MFRPFALAAVLAAVALAVLGSWVRINGAGLTCPDWPLCHGQLVPVLSGGVVLEWSHRLVAFLEGFIVIGALVTGWHARTRIAFVRPVLGFIAATFAVQVLLGGATVFLANNPPSVVWHWATAMLFLAGLVALALLAIVEPPAGVRPGMQSGLFPLLCGTAAAAFVAMCAGAYVSSSGDGLACLTFPACDGSWFGVTAGEAAQMVHRFAAGIVFVLATIAVYWAAVATTPRVRIFSFIGYTFVVVQILLGIANVAWALPTGLREAHAANAVATFIAYVTTVLIAVLDGTAVRARSAARRSAAAPTRATNV